MADTELGEFYGGAARGRGSFSNWIGLIGGLTSLAMVAGVGVWGYKLLMRDVTGIPVIRAMEGPMRVAPKDPGGERMANQGLAVNEVAAEGEAGHVADALTPAPPEPKLLDHDLPRSDLRGMQVPDLKGATDAAVASVLDAGAAEADDAGLADPDAMPPQDASASADIASPALDIEVIPKSVPGVTHSPRPPARPARLERAIENAAPAVERIAKAVAETEEISADSLPAGSRLVQLGAFESPDLARQEWGKMAVKFSDVMGGKKLVIQQANSGGETFYRLRAAGFEDLADARRFCATLGADRSKPLCVPVATR